MSIKRQPRTFEELLSWVTEEINLLKRRRVPRIGGGSGAAARAVTSPLVSATVSLGGGGALSDIAQVEVSPEAPAQTHWIAFDRELIGAPTVVLTKHFSPSRGAVWVGDVTGSGFQLWAEPAPGAGSTEKLSVTWLAL